MGQDEVPHVADLGDVHVVDREPGRGIEEAAKLGVAAEAHRARLIGDDMPDRIRAEEPQGPVEVSRCVRIPRAAHDRYRLHCHPQCHPQTGSLRPSLEIDGAAAR